MTNLFSLYAFVGQQLWHDWADNEPEDLSSGEMQAPKPWHTVGKCKRWAFEQSPACLPCQLTEEHHGLWMKMTYPTTWGQKAS